MVCANGVTPRGSKLFSLSAMGDGYRLKTWRKGRERFLFQENEVRILVASSEVGKAPAIVISYVEH
jgi:hypothetical protein